jgi:hypothetical protein
MKRLIVSALVVATAAGALTAVVACTKAQGAADLTLGLCVLGVVEKDWSTLESALPDSLVQCGALVPPIFSVQNAGEANSAEQYLIPIVDEAIRLVALEKGITLTPDAGAGQ